MAKDYVDILFGEFAPDFGGVPRPEDPGYLVDAVNVRPTPNGYRGMATFQDVTSATTATAATDGGVGACFYATNVLQSVVDPNTGISIDILVPGPTSFFFVNDSGTITESRDEGTDTWVDVTPASGATMNGTGNFVFMGGSAIYIERTRAPIYKSMSDAHSADFANLSGSPPTAQCGAQVRQHLVLGNLVGDDEFGIRTSAIGNHTDWPTPGSADARSKQSITESLNDEYGPIRTILGGEKFGIIVQDQALTRMTYVGGSTVYEFDVFERVEGGGLGKASRFATDGKLWYWHNDYSVYATDGYSVKSVSDGKIDEAIFNNNLSHPNGSSLQAAQSAAYDPRRSQIIFATRQGTSNSYHLTYDVTSGRFSFLNDSNVIAIFNGYSGDQNGARHVYNVGGSNRRLQRLDDSTSTIAMQTGYLELDPGYNVQIQGAHLLGTGTGSLTLAYKTAATASACDVSQSGFTSMTAASLGQKKTARATGQYVAFRVTGTGAESQLIRGIRIYFTRSQPAT